MTLFWAHLFSKTHFLFTSQSLLLFCKNFLARLSQKVPNMNNFSVQEATIFYASHRIKSSLGFNHFRLLTKNSLGVRSSKTQQFFLRAAFFQESNRLNFSKRSTQFFGQKLTFHLALDQSFSVKSSRPTVHRRLGKLIGNFMSIQP